MSLEFYRRWRHSHGFGVHSPLGYRLITEALYLPRQYAFYEEVSPALEADSPVESRLARRLYRGSIFMRRFCGIDSIEIFGTLPQSCREAFLRAGLTILSPSRHSVTPPQAAFFYGSPPPPTPFQGLELSGRHWALRIRRPGMAYTRYTLP